jgi:hypothetical protein
MRFDNSFITNSTIQEKQLTVKSKLNKVHDISLFRHIPTALLRRVKIHTACSHINNGKAEALSTAAPETYAIMSRKIWLLLCYLTNVRPV